MTPYDPAHTAPTKLSWHPSAYVRGALDSDCGRYTVTPSGRGDYLLIVIDNRRWTGRFDTLEAAQARAEELS